MKRFSFYIVFILIASVLTGMGLIYGEEPPVYEEEVVVTATRITENASESPGQTEVITKEEIKDSGAVTVAQLLTEESITISTNGGDSGAATIHLDGASAAQSLILINGLAANRGCRGDVDLSYFPTSIIDKVEITHGPLSALYGANALGGVVNIIYDLTGESNNELLIGGGSFTSGRFGYMTQQTKWGLAFGGSSTEGHRDYSQTNERYLFGQYDFIVNSDSAEKKDEYLSLYWQYLTKYGDNPGMVPYQLFDTNSSEKSYALNLNGQTLFGGGLWEYKFFGQKIEYIYNSGDYLSYDRHLADAFGIDLAGFYQLGQHDILTGLMLKREYFDSTVSGEHSQQNGGVFFQDSWNLRNPTKLVYGFRWDTGSDFSSPVMPRFSLVEKINDQFTLKFGYGKAFRSPTINELYWYQPDPFWSMFGNPNLAPEKAERYDLVCEWHYGSYNLAVNYYQSNIRDGIKWIDYVSDSMSVTENIDKLKVNGLNLRLEKSWNQVISTAVGYNWNDQQAWDEESGSYDRTMNYFGQYQFNFGLFFHLNKWQIGLSERLVSDREQDSIELPDYEVSDLNVNYCPIEDLSFNLVVNNLMNESYQVQKGFPMPGREFKISMNYSF